jgi:SAM-dependent methyltransferase
VSASTTTDHAAGSLTARGWLRLQLLGAPGRLVLISFLSLYLELTFIRWAPMQVRLLAYFSNYVLIASLLGLGLGMMLAGSRRRLIALFPPALLVMVVVVLVLERKEFVVPLVTEGQFVWNYLADIKASGLAAYAVLVGFFLAVAGLFALVGQEVGRALRPFASLRAYSLNIFGSLLGVIGFAVLSFLELSPPVWFAAGGAAFLAYSWSSAERPVNLVFAAIWLAATVAIVGWDARGTSDGAQRYWSPYYEIETTPILLGGKSIGNNITVNKDSHQQALDLSDPNATNPYITGRARLYNLPYSFVAPERVLVVGAGTGNDTAAALRNAPDARVDAVEIDPVIARLGHTLHPEHPYDADNVRVVIDDARSFLTKSDKPYDLIVFGFLDSHRLFSHMSSVRMDNYVYTLENFRRVRDRLSPDGIAAVTFTVHEKWIADRIYTVMTKAFGHPPLVYQGDANGWGTTFLIGREPLTPPAGAPVLDEPTSERELFSDRSRITWRYSDTEGYVDPAIFSDHAELLTDDWPFLYMRSRTIPPNYLLALVLTFIGSLLLVWRAVPSMDMKRPSNWNFFALGAAFALLETRAITEIALVFGSTWLTNTIVIGAILVMILLANMVVARWHPPLRFVYAGLFLVVIIDYLFPLQRLLGLSFWVQVLAAGIRVAAPMFFAGIIFARWFQRTDTPSAALGANLIGAVLGGLLEYFSLVIGLRHLYLLVLAFYLASAAFAWRSEPRQVGPAPRTG